ncbi:E3 ubiquitin-protein ligase MBR2-like [Hibiscus syriacus]|uniref:E3 ubiquitin-protein ligase MBR2-like n=1 Tax=Hibiscus syriacus TaxID=106335 RepID=UPI001923E1ED|nr:E3 ubiquitin-protein ligase MBR2-like [Hibiscus syriacus]
MQSQGQGTSSRENPTLRPFLENNGMNPNNGHISSNQGTTSTIVSSNSPGQCQGTGSRPSGSLQEDLNEPRLTLDLFTTGRSSSNQQSQASCGSSSPITIHSGSAGYVLEENIGLPSNGQSRLLCKRRVSEVSQPHHNIVINISHEACSSNNGTHLARPVAASSIQVGQTDNVQRNTRLRTTVSQQNTRPVNVSAAWNPINFNVQQAATVHHHPRPVVSPLGPFPAQNSPQILVLSNSAMLQQPIVGCPNQLQQHPIVGVPNQFQQQPIVAVPNPLQAPLPSQYWNTGTAMPPHGLPSFGSLSMMVPPVNTEPNMNLINGNPSFACSSGTQSGPGMYNSPFSSLGFHQPSVSDQNAQRLQYLIDRNEAWRTAHNYPIYNEAIPTIQDFEVALRNSNHRQTQVPPRSGAIAERQAGNNFQLSRPMTLQMAAQRRRRLISQVRNYLRAVRWTTGGLRTEDPLEMGRTFLQGMYVLENVHDDMRLDVDNMSYEELLDLEEQMGNVSSGLSEETIRANMRRPKFRPITAETEQCCICQEDYANGEELGKLDCGHDFHFNCIKQWLVQKNLCPVCKKTALAI